MFEVNFGLLALSVRVQERNTPQFAYHSRLCRRLAFSSRTSIYRGFISAAFMEPLRMWVIMRPEMSLELPGFLPGVKVAKYKVHVCDWDIVLLYWNFLGWARLYIYGLWEADWEPDGERGSSARRATHPLSIHGDYIHEIAGKKRGFSSLALFGASRDFL